MMKSYDQSVEINRNPNWPYNLDHPCRISIFSSSGSGKTNALLNLIRYQGPDFDKICLYVNNPFQSKYHLLMNDEKEKVEIKKLKNPKVFIEYLQTDVYTNLENYNSIIKRKK